MVLYNLKKMLHLMGIGWGAWDHQRDSRRKSRAVLGPNTGLTKNSTVIKIILNPSVLSISREVG